MLLAAVALAQTVTTLVDGVFGAIADKARGHVKYTWAGTATTTTETFVLGMTLDPAITNGWSDIELAQTLHCERYSSGSINCYMI